MKQFFSKKINKRGFTLIEVFTVIAISTLSFLAINSFILRMYRANSYATQQSIAIDQARRGVLDIVKCLRGATISDTGSFPIVSVATSTITFYSNIDADVNVEKVRYFLDGNILKRGVKKSTGFPLAYTSPEEVKMIAENVRNVVNIKDIFNYYNNLGVKITDLSKITDITFVKVNLIIDINPNRAPEDFNLRSSVSIRNLKTNL